MSNYLASTVKLEKPIPHPNADKLEGFVINGNRVWYGKDLLKEGDWAVFFPIECQINPVILSKLNLFSDKTLNEDNTKTGYFGHQGRVKAIRLRGEPSEGFILSLPDFLLGTNTTQADRLFNSVEKKESYSAFDCIENGIWVCRKYVPPVARNSGTGPKPKTKPAVDLIADGQFAFHYDTHKLAENAHKIEPDDIITITYKMHGTSAVFANLLTERKLNWKEKIFKWLGFPVRELEYSEMYSSRAVIKYIDAKYHSPLQGYYNEDVWGKAFKRYIRGKLEPGISIYAEIVGYQDHSKMIQKGYDYGYNPGDYGVYVYRITYTTPEGKVIEFNWDQLKMYCRKYDLYTVPLMYHGKQKHLAESYFEVVFDDSEISFLDRLKKIFLERRCNMCKNNVPAEGIVVRRESRNIEAWKLKSFAFLERETKQLDNEEVDLETQESVESEQ